jgi:hypothetical protein
MGERAPSQGRQRVTHFPNTRHVACKWGPILVPSCPPLNVMVVRIARLLSSGGPQGYLMRQLGQHNVAALLLLLQNYLLVFFHLYTIIYIPLFIFITLLFFILTFSGLFSTNTTILFLFSENCIVVSFSFFNFCSLDGSL